MEKHAKNLRIAKAVTDVTSPFVVGVTRARVTVQRHDPSHLSQTPKRRTMPEVHRTMTMVEERFARVACGGELPLFRPMKAMAKSYVVVRTNVIITNT